MDTHTTNGQTKTKSAVRKVAKKASPVVQKAKTAVARAEREGERIVKKGQNAVSEKADDVLTTTGNFVTRNPKRSVGIALGAGLLIGAVANRKYLRAAGLGLAAYLGKRYF